MVQKDSFHLYKLLRYRWPAFHVDEHLLNTKWSKPDDVIADLIVRW